MNGLTASDERGGIHAVGFREHEVEWKSGSKKEIEGRHTTAGCWRSQRSWETGR
jgi:hypothetical protein